MFKKLKIIFMVLLLSATLFPTAISAASSKVVLIDSIKVDYDTLNVTVTGQVENYVEVFLPQYVSLSVIDQNGNYQQIAEFEPEADGTFSYTYEHNQKNAVDSCTVTAKFLDSANTATSYYSIAGENQYEIFGTAIVFMKNSPTYFANGVKCETENPPYIENDEVYVPYTNEIKALGYNCSDEYIKLFAMENVYSNGEIFAIGNFDENIVNSIASYFGIYVSSDNGDDNNSGLFDSPVKTIEKSLELRTSVMGNPTVYLVSDEYRLDSTLSLNSSHSNLSVKAYPNTSPVIKKGKFLSADMFTEITDEEAYLFKDGIKNNILVASFETIKTSLASYEYNVFDGNAHANNSRYPNGNAFSEMTSVADTKTEETELINVGTEKSSLWNGVTDGRITVYRSCGYAIQKKNILSSDIATGVVTLDNPQKHYSPMGNIYYVENISKELDSPGEYYINPDKTKIYYYPKENFNGLEITTDKNPLLKISGAQNISFEKISFTQSGSDLIKIENSSNVTVSNGEIFGSEEMGINAQKISDCTFDNLIIYDTGSSGINLNHISDTGSDYDLTHENNVISNCDISDFGAVTLMDSGIALGGCGNIVKNNIVHDSLNVGITLMGCENSVIENDIYNVARQSKDTGAVYTSGILSAGNTIKNNIIHDTEGTSWNDNYVFGIYLDNSSSGITVDQNYIYNIPWAMTGNGGTSNTVTNNVLAKQYGASLRNSASHGYGFHNWILPNESGNVVYSTLYNLMNSSDYDSEKWNSKYSYLKDYYDEIMANNVTFNSDGSHICSDTSVGIPRNMTVTNNIVAGRTENEVGKFDFVSLDTASSNLENNTFITLNDFETNKNSYLGNLNLSQSGLPTEKNRSLSLEPEVLFPYNDSHFVESISEIIWEKEKTADKYRIIVSQNSDLSNPVCDEVTFNTAFNLPQLENGTYYYRVDGIKGSYNSPKTDVGEVRKFTIGDEWQIISQKLASISDNKVRAEIVSLEESDLTFDIVLAEKDANGKVVNVNIISKKNFAALSSEALSYTMQNSSNKLELYVWDGMTPLSYKNNLYN